VRADLDCSMGRHREKRPVRPPQCAIFELKFLTRLDRKMRESAIAK
jgi:hypothetical protein